MKAFYQFILIFVIVVLHHGIFVEGNCVMYDQCMDKTCVYNGPPLPLHLSNQTLNKLGIYCPSLDIPNLMKYSCCSPQQVKTFLESINSAIDLLKRCPACLINFLQAMCQLTCSPMQSEFLIVDNTTQINDNKAMVNAVSFIISTDYVNPMLDSCRHVQFGASNAYALSLLCQMHVDDCTPELLFETISGNSPFEINAIFSNSSNYVLNNISYTPMYFDTIPCSQKPRPDSAPCSCSDCTCDPLPIIPDADLWLIGTIPGSYIVMGALFTVYFIALVVAFLFQGHRRKRDTPLLMINEDGSQIEIQSLPLPLGEEVSLSKIERFLQHAFTSWGRTCARNPWTVIVISLIATVCLIYGVTYYQVTTDPVQLWSAPSSTARLQREHFDAHFGPFYRTEQIIMTPANDNVSIYDWDFFMKMVKLQEEVMKLTDKDGNFTLNDICIKPVNDKCAIFSAFNWFQNNASNIDPATYRDKLSACSSNPFLKEKDKLPCFGDYGGPVFTYLALGGYEGKNYDAAKAYVLTFPVQNHNKADDLVPALAWEEAFIGLLKNYSDPNVTIYFSTERSIEDEISREGWSDVSTIACSYLIMFLYVFLALGTYRTFDTWLLSSKLTLGFCGVFLVLASFVASIGFFSYLGVPATLIIIEVIPFLVLAVGVDNIFILVQTFERDVRRENETLEDQIGRTMGKVAPSLLLTSLSESLCFFLGALAKMPAVRIFALYAGQALIIDFLLQITCFLALLTLDARRRESGRLDVFCCIKTRANNDNTPSPGIIYKFFDKYLSKWLMYDTIRSTLLIIFIGWLCLSIAVIPQIDVGLDQKMSVPKDSYVLKYFEGLAEYLEVGPPVYFVVKGNYNYSNHSAQNLLCGISGCYRYSLQNLASQWIDQENITFLAKPTNNWLNDYNEWMGSESCCRYNETTKEYCPKRENNPEWENCTSCSGLRTGDVLWPVGEIFYKFLPHFLESIPDSKCISGGKPSYKALVELLNSTEGDLRPGATSFMGYHSTLRDSHDFTKALEMSRRLAANITFNLHANGISKDIQVYPYSVFYVFYEQYLTIWKDLGLSCLISIFDIFIVTLLLMGLNSTAAFCNTFAIVAILVDVMGLMYALNIPLNAVSAVNLIMAIGISVEFCSHITRAFILSKYSTRKERAQDALATMGSSVLSGITLTKFGGIIVLAFSKSQIFEVFYFRMYTCIVFCGATHGLIFLPILLSYVGPLTKRRYLQSGQRRRDLYEKI